MDKQKKLQKLAKLQDIIDNGNPAIARFLFALEDNLETAVADINDVIAQLQQQTVNADTELRNEFDTFKPTTERLIEIITPLIPEVKDGLTPTKEELLALISPLIPKVKDGKTPSKEELLAIIKPLIPEIDTDEIVAEAVAILEAKIKLPSADELVARVEKDLPKLGEPIRDSLELLTGDNRLDRTAVKGLEDYDEISELARQERTIVKKYYGGGGSGGSSGASAFTDLTDTFDSYTGLAGKGLRVNTTEDGIDTYTPTDTDEKVKYDASDPTAGYISDKFIAGTGITLSEGTGADENKLVITNTLDLSGYVPYTGATADLNLGDYHLLAEGAVSHDSHGFYFKNQSLANVASFGLGGGQNWTFYDGVKLDGGTASRVLLTDASKNISYSTLTSAELEAIPTTYAKLDGTNQPFTGDVTVSKANPKLTVTDTGLSSSAWLEKDTTLDGSRLVSQGRPYAVGLAMSLNGSGYTSRTAYSIGTVYSFDFWFKTSTSQSNTYIVDSNTGFAYPLIIYSGTQWYARTALGQFKIWNVTYADGNWHHYVLSRNGATIDLIRDGVSLGSQTLGGSDTNNFYTLGADRGGANRVIGDFDEFVVWDKALSVAEAGARYNGGAGSELSSYTNVLAEYRFNNNYNDSSPNARTLTAGGTGNSFSAGKVAAPTQPLEDIPVIRIANSTNPNSYGLLTAGYYSGVYGTSNIYEGVSHQWNYLGTSKMTLGSAGVNISAYTGNLAVGSALSAGTTVSAGTVFLGGAGTAGAPTFATTADPDTGAYSGGANIYNIATAGTLRYQIDASGNNAWGTTTSTAIFARYSKSQTQLTTASTIAQYEGTHTQNADNAFGWAGSVTNVGLNTAGFNNTTAISSGTALSGGYALVQLQSTPATGTTTAICGHRTSVRNTGAAVLTNAISYLALPVLNSGAGSITNAFGFYSSALTAATNNYDFYGLTTAATGRWGFYQAGGAQNYLAGNLGLGVTTPAETLELKDAGNIKFQTTTGTKIGTATTQKIGFWNATPIVQPTTAVTAATFAANTSGIVDDTAAFDGYTIGQVVKALRNAGLLA